MTELKGSIFMADLCRFQYEVNVPNFCNYILQFVRLILYFSTLIWFSKIILDHLVMLRRFISENVFHSRVQVIFDELLIPKLIRRDIYCQIDGYNTILEIKFAENLLSKNS